MSEFMTTLVISGSILALMVVTQFGRRDYTWHKALRPVAAVGVFGYIYLHGAPIDRPSLTLYGVGIAVGLVFAWFANRTTKMEKDTEFGSIYTICGLGFVVTWTVAVMIRIGFVWSVENVPSFRNQVGEFMINTHLTENAIAPFFCLMALVTVIARTAVVAARANKLAAARTAGIPVLV